VRETLLCVRVSDGVAVHFLYFSLCSFVAVLGFLWSVRLYLEWAGVIV
jgi:hypothetical protein